MWLKYSNGRFGFSIQKQIWIDCGGTINKILNGTSVQKQTWIDCGGTQKELLYETEDEVIEEFVLRLGWLKGGKPLNYEDITFNTNARQGHLPLPLLGIKFDYDPKSGDQIFLSGVFRKDEEFLLFFLL